MATRTTTPQGLLLHAEEFVRAADAVMAKEPKDRLPAYYLLGHAIELALKAFLLAAGVSIRELKKSFGHNLVELTKEAQKRELGRCVAMTRTDAAVIQLLAPDYLAKKIRVC